MKAPVDVAGGEEITDLKLLLPQWWLSLQPFKRVNRQMTRAVKATGMALATQSHGRSHRRN